MDQLYTIDLSMQAPNQTRSTQIRTTKNRQRGMKTEIELLKLNTNNHEQKYKIIDNEMIKELKLPTNEQFLQNVTKLWKDDWKSEEIISFQWWENNINLFLSCELQLKRDYASDNPFLKEIQNKYIQINQ